MAIRELLFGTKKPTDPTMQTYTLPKHWPLTTADETRIKGYVRNRAIWDGNHALALDEQDIAGKYGQYVTVNLAKILVTIPADFLFGEQFELEFPEDSTDDQQLAVKEILQRSDELIRTSDEPQTMFYESKLDAGIDGDAVILVDRNDAGQAVLRAQPACDWCPELDPDNKRRVIAHWIGWKRTVEINRKERDFIRLVKHEPGVIRNFVVELNKDGTLGPDNAEGWDALYPDEESRPPKEIKTNIEGFALEHIPNWRTARDYFGIAEFKGIDGMFASLNARVTQGDQVLHRHTDPILGLPSDTFTALRGGATAVASGQLLNIDKAKLDVVKMGENGEKPEYVVWDGKLADNLAYIDKVVDLIALVSETAPQLLNSGEWGGDLSGKALKIMLIRTLAKVNRSRLYYSVAIPNLLVKAQQAEGIENPVRPSIKWPDGLPQDIQEAIDVADKAIAARITSRKQAIMEVYDVDEDAAEARLQEIEGEEDVDRNSEALANATMLGPTGQGRKNPIQVKVG